MRLLEGSTGLVLKIAVSLTLIGILFWQIDLGSAWLKISAMPKIWLMVALALMVAQTLIASARWYRLNLATGLPLTYGETLKFFVIGTFFNQTLPSSVGGDVVRIVLIQRCGVSLGAAFSNILTDRIFGFLGLILIAAAGIPTILDLLNRPTAIGLIGIILLGLTAVGVFLLLGSEMGARLTRLRFLQPFHQTGLNMLRVLVMPGRAAIIVGLSLLTHALMIIMVWALAKGLVIDLTVGIIAALIPISVLATMLPISVAGWGVREGAVVVLLGFVGIAAEDALVLSLLNGLILTAIGLPGGLLWLTTRKKADSGLVDNSMRRPMAKEAP